METIDKLCFIYINTRALKNATGEKEWTKLEWQELMEDILLSIEDDITSHGYTERSGDQE